MLIIFVHFWLYFVIEQEIHGIEFVMFEIWIVQFQDNYIEVEQHLGLIIILVVTGFFVN